MARTLIRLGFLALPAFLAFAPLEPALPAALAASAQHGAPSATCADCHAEIQREWAGSLHGTAWTNESYQKALKRRRGAQRDACLPCHVPQPLGAAQLELDERGLPPPPVARTQDLHEGIGCATCHLADDGAMLGPFGGATSAHATRRDERFAPARVDRLCLGCHATEIGPVLPLGQDFVAAPPREPAASCVGCHMAPVERAMATDGPDGDPAPLRAGRSHALRGARDAALLAEALAFRATRAADGSVVLVVKNSGAAHRTPGLVGRSWKIDAEPLRPLRPPQAQSRRSP